MARIKLFISYSHRDRSWLERLNAHLSLLQRQGLLHVWSDTGIGIGDRWQDEIESALSDSKVAVLIVSPNFLASEFIWREEMPRIIAHEKQGLTILPLIARPCAWRIANELAALQARPTDGRALALNTEAEIDQALTDFVYELALRINLVPTGVASEERRLPRQRQAEPLRKSEGVSNIEAVPLELDPVSSPQ